MNIRAAMIFLLSLQILATALSQPAPAKMIGSWEVQLTFDDRSSHLLRWNAQDAGKGAFLLADPQAKVWGPAKPSSATWSLDADGLMVAQGGVEFLLGNVGRDAGTLVLKGKLDSAGVISGAATFFRTGQEAKDPKITPAKRGTFKATRSPGR